MSRKVPTHLRNFIMIRFRTWLLTSMLAFPISRRKVAFSFIFINMSSALLYNFSDCSSPSPLPTPIARRGLSYHKIRATSVTADDSRSKPYLEVPHKLPERKTASNPIPASGANTENIRITRVAPQPSAARLSVVTSERSSSHSSSKRLGSVLATQEKAQGNFTTKQVHELRENRQPSHAGDHELTEKKKQQHTFRSLMSILALRYTKSKKRSTSDSSHKAGKSVFDNDTYIFGQPPSSSRLPTPLGNSDHHSDTAPRSARGLAVFSTEDTSPKRKASGARRRSILRRSIDTGRFSHGRERTSLEDTRPVSLDFDESVRKRAEQRAEKLKDLVQSEESYVADLKILHDVCPRSKYVMNPRCLRKLGLPYIPKIHRSSINAYPDTLSTKCGRNLEAPPGPLGPT